jgi:uncharacterized protein
VLRVALGDVAHVVTTGQRVLPAKALALGYAFRYPELEGALRALSSKKHREVEAPAHRVPAGAGSHH